LFVLKKVFNSFSQTIVGGKQRLGKFDTEYCIAGFRCKSRMAFLLKGNKFRFHFLQQKEKCFVEMQRWQRFQAVSNMTANDSYEGIVNENLRSNYLIKTSLQITFVLLLVTRALII